MLAHFLTVLLFAASVSSDCPPNTIYESIFGKCYKYVSQPTSFLTAEQNCNSIGGNLVALRNAFEGAYVSGIAAEGGSSGNYWIGANFLMSSQWSWTSNSPMNYTNWASGQSADPSAYQCGAVQSVNNQWTKELCNSARSYICTVDPNAVTPSPTSAIQTLPTCPPQDPIPTYQTDNLTCTNHCSGRVCSDGFIMYPGNCKCYSFSNIVRTWNDSIAYCGSQGATLAVITTAELNCFLAELSATNDPGKDGLRANPWIGLQCSDSIASSCYWVDGTPLSGYTNFRYGDIVPGLYAMDMEESNSFGTWWYASFNYIDTVATFCQKNSLSTRTLVKASAKTSQSLSGKRRSATSFTNRL